MRKTPLSDCFRRAFGGQRVTGAGQGLLLQVLLVRLHGATVRGRRYRASTDRPMADVLAPPRLDISAEYKRRFAGMVDQPVTLDDLLKAGEDLIAEIVGKMAEQHKRFPICGKRSEPDWALVDVPDAKDLRQCSGSWRT
ncbi:MAG: hypothetical protein WB762_12795 [Candidatus Sulfotelmatobacter sp.]